MRKSAGILRQKASLVGIGLLSLAFFLCNPASAVALAWQDGSIETVVVYGDGGSSDIVEVDPKIMTSASFATSWRSPGFYVRNGSVEVAIDSICSINGSYTVDLLRNASVVGTAQFKRNGYTKVSWKNVPAGTYCLRLSKSNDVSVVKCKAVRISV